VFCKRYKSKTRLELDHASGEADGQLALEEGGDLQQRTLSQVHAARVVAIAQQEAEPRVERRLERHRCLRLRRDALQLLLQTLIRRRLLVRVLALRRRASVAGVEPRAGRWSAAAGRASAETRCLEAAAQRRAHRPRG